MNDRSLLAPMAYLREIRDYLREREGDLWAWFTAERAKADYGEALRLNLQNSATPLLPEAHPELYRALENAQLALGVDLPVTLYQAQDSSSQSNATLFYLPNESHIVLRGPIVSLLQPLEWTAVFGHELAHRLLWDAEDGDFLIADHLLDTISRESGAQSAYVETARRFRLSTEIFADRGAFRATHDLTTTVTALVKISTGLTLANGEHYLEQAEAIFAQGEVTTSALSHPEIFMRVHALARWTSGDGTVDTWVRAMVAEKPELATLDLLEQQSLTALTRRFLAQYLQPEWFQSEAVLAQARRYFADFTPSESEEDPTLVDELRQSGKLLHEYFIFVLLDFVRVDPDLGQQPLIAALRWAEALGASRPFEKLVAKELGVKARELAKIKPPTAAAVGWTEVKS